ncbi:MULTISPECIES: hypothetical protein [Pseudoalteromonas]|uniref:hypothetical protein n=1 Tax=Pseudoalteromonas TaxID=53246 RepID=UPI001EF52EBA|nr:MULTISPECIES: hypothetical protein [Pseudoalteromonas]MCG7561460.1 hypothetical protein [Pseudoalteromonas sp. McH1-42]MEC4088047.1 hypothetical protein [Pseudoalteromonas rubra]
MPNEKIRSIKQNTWLHAGGGPSAGGVCYGMCNYIESKDGPWFQANNYENAVKNARDFTAITAMMNFAKSQQVRNSPFHISDGIENGELAFNRLYRMTIWVGKTSVPKPKRARNHELIVCTGSNHDEIVYFDPNFGFFHPSEAGKNNREALEYCIARMYADNNSDVDLFGYTNIRALNKKSPQGYPAG